MDSRIISHRYTLPTIEINSMRVEWLCIFVIVIGVSFSDVWSLWVNSHQPYPASQYSTQHSRRRMFLNTKTMRTLNSKLRYYSTRPKSVSRQGTRCFEKLGWLRPWLPSPSKLPILEFPIITSCSPRKMCDEDSTMQEVHSLASRMIMASPEPDFWMFAVCFL